MQYTDYHVLSKEKLPSNSCCTITVQTSKQTKVVSHWGNMRSQVIIIVEELQICEWVTFVSYFPSPKSLIKVWTLICLGHRNSLQSHFPNLSVWWWWWANVVVSWNEMSFHLYMMDTFWGMLVWSRSEPTLWAVDRAVVHNHPAIVVISSWQPSMCLSSTGASPLDKASDAWCI